MSSLGMQACAMRGKLRWSRQPCVTCPFDSPCSRRHIFPPTTPPLRHTLSSRRLRARLIAMFKNSSLVRCAARSTPALPSRPTAPSIAPFTSRAHQRRHSSSKPPVPPNNGSPSFPADVKQVTHRSEAKAERKKPAERSSKKAAAKAEATEENWTSIFPSVPGTSHMSQKGMSVIVRFD